MHRPLKKFGFRGILDDSDFIRLRAQYESLILGDMRSRGYVPILDVGPFWSTTYMEKSKLYEFEITIYGIFVGRKKSKQIEGMSGDGTLHPRSTPQIK